MNGMMAADSYDILTAPMKARELLKRYRNGERDFCGVDLGGESLRGMNLADIDLSEANLSETDLRGTEFTRAKLVETQFAKARMGTQRRWIVPIFLLTLFLIGLSSFVLGVLVASFLATVFDPRLALFGFGNDTAELSAGITGIGATLAVLFFYYRQGLLAMLGAVTVATAIAIAVAIAIAGGFAGTVVAGSATAFAVAIATAFAFTVVAGSSIAFTVAFTVAFAVAFVVTFSFIVAFAGAFSFVVSGAAAGPFGVSSDALIIVLACAVILIFSVVNFLISRRALAGDPRDQLIRDVAVGLASLGGTSFHLADLTHAHFSEAVVKSVHFRNAVLHQTCFHRAKILHLSRAYKTILADRTVLNLLVSLKSEKDKSYIGLNLKGANLSSPADLADIDFTEADFSGATLAGANLQRATLTKVQALGTNFHQTNLTAACLEAWNIDTTTQLDGAICDHVYLLRNQQERRPHTGSFAPGEFTKLFEEVLNTVDLIFRDGIDWRAFLQTFRDVQVQHEGAALEIQSIENKGDGVMVVRLTASPNADKEQIHLAFRKGYSKALKAAEYKYKMALQSTKIQHQEEIIALHRERSADLKEIATLSAQQPITRIMTDQSQSISVSGDFNLNADNSVVSLRDISGQVTNQINQLGSDSTQLQDLLTQLKTAIETEPALLDTDKADALEQVEKIAEAGHAPAENKSRAKRAIDFIKSTTEGLTETNKLVEACKTLLPAIGLLFGLVL